MVTYRENTPAVRAKQWNGTIGGARSMFDFLSRLELSEELHYKIVYFLNGDRIDESASIQISYHSGAISPNCWIVVDEGQNVTVMTDVNFQDRYHQVVT